MAFDQTKPATTDNYATEFIPGIKANLLALAMWLDSSLTSITGTIPTGFKRYNRTSGRIEEYSGSAWGNLTVNVTNADSAGTAGTANALNTANSYGAVNLVLSGAFANSGGIQFTNATAQDAFLQVDSGRTLRWRNSNAGAPNWAVVGFETGKGYFNTGIYSAGEIGTTGNNAIRLGLDQAGGAAIYYHSNGNLAITPRSGYGTAITAGDLTLGIDQTSMLIKSPVAGGAIQLKADSGTANRGVSLGVVSNAGVFSSALTYSDASGAWTSAVSIYAPTFVGGLSGNATTATSATTQTAGNNTTAIATTAFVQTAVASAPGLGVGQTWQDMTGSRSFGASVTNGTGKLIALNVAYSGSFVVGDVTCTLGSGPVLRSGFIGNPGGGVYISSANFLVPAGDSYMLSFVSVTGSVAITKWWELR